MYHLQMNLNKICLNQNNRGSYWPDGPICHPFCGGDPVIISLFNAVPIVVGNHDKSQFCYVFLFIARRFV